MGVWVTILEMIGTVAFSISGAMVAIKKNMDLLGVLVLGLITAVGGGTIRDIITGQIPPNVFLNYYDALVASIVALITFVVAKISKNKTKSVEKFEKVLSLSDAIGLGVFTVVGIYVVEERFGNDNVFLLVFVGVITGVGGGILRDMMSGNIPYVFVKHIYATASIIGAVAYILLSHYCFNDLWSMITSIIVVIVVRILAAHFKWNLPRVYNK